MTDPDFDGGAFANGLMRLVTGNFEALAAAQRRALEGLAALGRQVPPMPDLPTPPSDGRQAIAAPIEVMKAALLDSTAQANAVTEILTRANAEAASILQDRALAALDEWKVLLLGATGQR